MNRKASLFLALLAFAFGAAQAVPVSQTQAASAAAAWARSGDALGAKLGATVDMAKVRTVSVRDNVVFHAVPFKDGGIVFTSGDTEHEPIVAFSSNGNVDLSEKSPLVDLLKKDAWLRYLIAQSRSTAAGSSAVASPTAATSAAADGSSATDKWNALLAMSEAPSATATSSGSVTAAAKPEASVSDIRVEPIIKSKWSQEYVGPDNDPQKCFNFYTPMGIPCGCTATAAAQVMRYFTFPTAEVAPAEFSCTVSGASKKLSTVGGVYDWSNMKLDPMDSATETEREAIGRLTYDIGVALGSDYSDGGTGADPEGVAATMRDVFGYANVFTFWNGTTYANGKGGLHDLSLRKRVIYANLDARMPVQLAIYGYEAGHFGDSRYWGGHAVVADGYGFKSIDGAEVAFVHINMGWGGSDDMWYNIPDINTSETGFYHPRPTDYCYLGGATFNVFTQESGLEVFSGRVTDSSGKPVEGAEVALQGDAGSLTCATDEYGIYSFTVPGGVSYSVRAVSKDGTLIAERDPVVLPKTVGSDSFVVASSSSVGNSWGNDLVLAPPAAQVGEEVYSTLARAFAAAKELSASVEIPTVVLLEEITLEKDFTVDFNCLLASGKPDPKLTAIVRGGSAISVAAGGALTLSNVVFAASSATPVEVAAGGRLTITGVIGFGVNEDVAAVRTADAQGLAVVGALGEEVSVSCAAASAIGTAFGTLSGVSAEAAADTAARIVNFDDGSGDIRGIAEGAAEPFVLKWAEVPVPFDVCSCYYVDAGGGTNTSARIDRLMAAFSADLAEGKVAPGAEIVLRKSGTLSVPVAVASDISIRGENGARIKVADPASFTVAAGGRLAVEGVGFDGFRGNSLFLVNGGELALGNGVSIVGAIGTNYYSGAVTVMGGSATLGPGIVITGCKSEYSGSSNGGGVYVNAGATLNFHGGEISGCEVNGNGGGIYLNKASMTLCGEVEIYGNVKFDGMSGVANNIYAYGVASSITIVGPVSGKAGVSYGSTAGTKNWAGGRFAELGQGLSAADLGGIGRGMSAFANDTGPELGATFNSDQTGLVWTEDSAAAGTVPDNLVAFAGARVVEPGGATVHYWSVADAFEAVEIDGSSVEMLCDGSFDGELTVANKEVRLASAAGIAPASLTGGTFGVTGSLVLADVLLSGENLFNIDGGLLYLEGPVVSAVGCTGGSAADTNVFAEVRCALSYDSLTNSAANFRNGQIDAYGVAVTNVAGETLVVWSRSVNSDGTFVGADGAVWGCVGEVPVYETPAVPEKIAFSAIVRDEAAGTWNLTLTNLVRGCWYSLYATNSLAGAFAVGEGICEPVTNFQAEADGEFIFKVQGDGKAMFWKAVAEPGVITE